MKNSKINKKAQEQEFGDKDLESWERQDKLDLLSLSDKDIADWESKMDDSNQAMFSPEDVEEWEKEKAALKKAIKERLLKGEKIAHRGWETFINDSDEIELWSPKGDGNAASLAYLDFVVGDFLKQAAIAPEKTPKPVGYDKITEGLGEDSTKKDPFKKVKVNDSSEPDGKGSDGSLGEDSSSKEPFKMPDVDKGPQPSIERGGLPEGTELGEDSTLKDVEWINPLKGNRKKARAGKDELKEALRGLFLLKGGVSEIYGGTTLDMSAPNVYVAIMHDGSGFNPLAALCFGYKNHDETLQAADEILENITFERLSEDERKEMWETEESEGYNPITERFDGMVFTMTPEEFKQVIEESENNKRELSVIEFEYPEEDLEDEEDFDKEGSIIDTFEKEASPLESYADLVAQSPSKNLIKNIFNPEKWAVDRMLENIEKEAQEEIEAIAPPGKEDLVKELKKDKNVDNPWAVAWSQHNKEKGKASNKKRADGFEDLFVPGAFDVHEGPKQDESLDYMLGYLRNSPDLDELPKEVVDVIFKPIESMDGEDYAVIRNAYKQFYEGPMPAILSSAKRKDKESARLRESWGDGYSRDLEAESVVDLYHATRALSSDEDYDWETLYKPMGTGDNAQVPVVDEAPKPLKSTAKHAQEEDLRSVVLSFLNDHPELAKEAISHNNDWGDVGAAHYLLEKLGEDFDESKLAKVTQAIYSFRNQDKPDQDIFKEWASKKAVDDKAKEYWEKYYGDYGKKMVKEKEKKDKKEAQAIDSAPEMAQPGGPGSNPSPSPQSPSAQPKVPQQAPVKPAPGAGDAALTGLGWTKQDIAAMSDQDKQNILKIKLRKPGSGGQAQPQNNAPKAPQQAPQAPSPKPQSPAQPPANMPQDGIAPLPAHSPVAKKDAQAVPQQDPAQMQPNPSQAQPPAPKPKSSPSAPVKTGPEESDPDFTAEDGSIEGKVFDIYKEVKNQEIQASSPDEVKIDKAKTLVQRVLTETGMPIDEVKTLLGVGENESLTKLFK